MEASGDNIKGSVLLVVSILDINDNRPVFLTSDSYIDVMATNQVGAVVSKFEAQDKDEGENGIVRYSLLTNGDGRFDINETAGAIKQNVQRCVCGWVMGGWVVDRWAGDVWV